MNHAPDYIEPVVGWRTWSVSESEGRLRLRSVMFEAIWVPGRPFVADCRNSPHLLRRLWHRRPRIHASPDFSCSCGIYAATSLSEAARYAESYGSRYRYVVHRVLGRVSLWGTVLEYTEGWRASRAYPLELFVPRFAPKGSPGAEAVAIELADYGVRVEIVEGEDVDELLGSLAAAEPGLAAAA
jgi:hypothetical protein